MFDEYVRLGGTNIQRRTLVQKLNADLADQFILLSSRGYESRLLSKSQASALLGMKESPSEVEVMNDEEAICKVAKLIVAEIEAIDDNFSHQT